LKPENKSNNYLITKKYKLVSKEALSWLWYTHPEVHQILLVLEHYLYCYYRIIVSDFQVLLK